MKKAFIKYIEIHTPKEVLTNDKLGQIFDIGVRDIFNQTGIQKRFISAKGELASDLAYNVGKTFFENNPIGKVDIDMLIYCTSALDYVGPATACLIHERLQLPSSCAAIDIPMGCAGFSNGLVFSKALIENGTAKNILFITADMPTKVVHPDDYYLRSIFSDAAAATLISNEGNFELGNFDWGTDGSGAENLIIKGSGARNPVDADWIKKYEKVDGLLIGRMEMNGIEILKFSLREVPKLFTSVLEKNQLDKKDIDLFIFHHASGIVLKYLAKKLLIDPAKVFSCLEDYGNTVSASIPIAIYNAEKKGILKTNSRIFIAGFGIGYSWSGTILNYKQHVKY